MLPGNGRDHATRHLTGVWPPAGLDASHQVRDVLVQVDVSPVVVEVEVQDASTASSDVAISEVPAEEFGVRELIQGDARATRTRHPGVPLASR
jgi:hypothetical protein